MTAQVDTMVNVPEWLLWLTLTMSSLNFGLTAAMLLMRR